MEETAAKRREFFRLRGHTVHIFGRKFRLPANRIARVAVGVGFIVGGFLSFLPVLGVWMLPLGLLILSIDLAFVRRWRRKADVKWGRRRRRKAADG